MKDLLLRLCFPLLLLAGAIIAAVDCVCGDDPPEEIWPCPNKPSAA
jgi:hypothetical protein